MIFKGSQRGGEKQMAIHLLNTELNEHINVYEIRGFVTPDDIGGALNEAYAVSKGTQCKQFMYSVSFNPPQNEKVPVSVFMDAIEKSEQKLGLEDQPRVVVFHEKEGHRHAHCVWSRIDIENMKAVNMSHDHRKLNSLSKSLYLEHGWELPKGFQDKSQKNPLNYTRAEWQQAARTGRKRNEIETNKCSQRDMKEKDALIQDQLSQRKELQDKIIELRETQLTERQALVKEMSHLEGLEQSQVLDEREQFQERNKDCIFRPIVNTHSDSS